MEAQILDAAANPTFGAEIDPRIVQGILTLLAAIIASATALYIALAVYARQKHLDARIRLAEQIRSTCAEFAELCSSIIDDPSRISHKDNAIQSVGWRISRADYYVSLLAMLRAPNELLELAQELREAYSSCLKAFYESCTREISGATGPQLPNPELQEALKKVFEKRSQFILAARNISSPRL